MIGFRSYGEILNRGFKRNRITFGHNSGKKRFPEMKKRCEKRARDSVIRDVVQTTFVVRNIDWLMARFNVIYLVRPQKEIRLCCKLRGWNFAIGKLSAMLGGLPDDVVRFDYYDFVFGPQKKLYKVLRRWYPQCRKINYLTCDFIRKRDWTMAKLRHHGLKVGRRNRYGMG
jgi:hypothetical protein